MYESVRTHERLSAVSSAEGVRAQCCGTARRRFGACKGGWPLSLQTTDVNRVFGVLGARRLAHTHTDLQAHDVGVERSQQGLEVSEGQVAAHAMGVRRAPLGRTGGVAHAAEAAQPHVPAHHPQCTPCLTMPRGGCGGGRHAKRRTTMRRTTFAGVPRRRPPPAWRLAVNSKSDGCYTLRMRVEMCVPWLRAACEPPPERFAVQHSSAVCWRGEVTARAALRHTDTGARTRFTHVRRPPSCWCGRRTHR